MCAAGELGYRAARIENPLKGIIPSSYGRTKLSFPHSLRYLDMSLSQLMTGEERFNWAPLERNLERIRADGKQAVVRIYLDWPGRTNSIPVFLRSETEVVNGVRWREGERIPNYESPDLQAALKDFVAAFGARWDGHPDIAFIEAGLLGPWGEWLSAGKAGPMASEEVQREIVDAYEAAFQMTKILVRFPTADTVNRGFGYHDDWFGFKRGGLAPHFEKLGITEPATWLRAPMGGRVHPEIQDCLANRRDPCELAEKQYEQIASGHFSYLRLDHSQNAIQPGSGWENARRFAQRLGYEFYVTEAALTLKDGGLLNVRVSIKNTGVAPFYYRWPVEIAVAKDGIIQQRWETDWDMRRVIPEEQKREFVFLTQEVSVAGGKHEVLLRMRGPSSREHYVKFANETQDADVMGWLTLGEVMMKRE